ncbi:hypothetical protein ACFPYJ_07680 [Paenibacillus solisilvae]|uniref:Uncharacterized protein n=1 Tax=Paenibacillus solisilvae TaxID=2486751 RepID=A0ABW0VTU8_9BACL
MQTFRDLLIDYYKDTDYRLFRKGVPRPREWHFPKMMFESFKKDEVFFNEHFDGKKIIIPLDHEDIRLLRVTLLHESIFAFYKSFYNYLAAKNLYRSGALHWIEITNYYSKLYLARAINTLCGIQSYRVSSDKFIFIEHIYKLLKPKKYQELSNKYKPEKIDFEKDIVAYSMHLRLDIEKDKGEIVIDDAGINSHDDTWKIYSEINHEELNLTKLTYEDILDRKYNHLSKERNEENYSFDGYMQIDFNLPLSTFKQFFERDNLKGIPAELPYDETVGITLGVFSELYHLYKDLNVDALPIETDKFEYICSYMIESERLKEKLLDLCKSGFPLKNKYIDEMNAYLSGYYGDQ